MDPAYAEQAKRFRDKQKTTNVATGSSLVENLSAFIKESSGRIGSGAEDLLQRRVEEEERARKAESILAKNRDVVEKRVVAPTAPLQPRVAPQPPSRPTQSATTTFAGPTMKSHGGSDIPVLKR